MNAVDLFAGPGGWDVAAAALGFEPLGIEWDEAACATREAAGLRTLRADVAALKPEVAVREHLIGRGYPLRLDGLIGGPPCQAFSMAGKGEGRKAIAALLDATAALGTPGEWKREALDAACDDPRAHLVLEPLRWALALRPRWVALEQVEPVLPLWQATGERLRALGYSVWTGVLSAERYGVPQTRRRAFLIASLDRTVSEPVATHRRYVAPRRSGEATLALFDAPAPERIELPEEAHLLPWVSMDEALGWGMTARPSVSVLAKPGGTGGHRPLEGGTGARETLRAAREAGEWEIKMPGGATFGTARAATEPAPTLSIGKGPNDVVWRRTGDTDWTTRRPATTVAGDPRIFAPGHKLNADDERAGRGAQLRSGGGHTTDDDAPATVRVTVEEAAVLQSFPADYPWQGTRTRQFEQVGNAVPPRLALAVLRAVV